MKFLPSLTGTMSGSMGGCTASHNRAGMYFRNRVVPTNPNTTRQQNVRAYFTAAVNAWASTLTAAERADWETWAANVPFLDTLGQTFFLTGQQAFIRANVVGYQLGRSTLVAAPIDFNNGQPIAAIAPATAATPGQIGVILATSAFSIAATLMDDAPDDGDVALYLGPPVSPSVNFYKGSYQFAAQTPIAAAAGGVSFTTLVAAQHQATPLVVGQFRPVRLRVAYDDGRLSIAYEAIAEVIDDT